MSKQLLFLSWGQDNPKVGKRNSELGYLTATLHLTPNFESQVPFEKKFSKWVSSINGYYNVCPSASKGCRQGCLYHNGRAKVFKHITRRRNQKTRLLLLDPLYGIQQLTMDIQLVSEEAKKQNKLPAIRLNTTSDLAWEHLYFDPSFRTLSENPAPGLTNLFELFPDISFYDYTKRVERLDNLPENYHLSFSKSESNDPYCQMVLRSGKANVVVVFRKELPESFWGYPVIDGDEHDLRFLDPGKPLIVGLRAKGGARKDDSGFVVDERRRRYVS